MALYWRSQTAQVQQMVARMTFLRQVLNQATTIISPSKFLRSMYIDAGIDADRLLFMRQGHDFHNVPPELLVKTPSDCLRIGYVGQITQHKGVHILFEAMKEISNRNVKVIAYGNTEQFPQYTSQLKSLIRDDARVILAGSFKREELSSVLRNLDIIVVPSLWYENSPNVILEAFAHRTPVIASDLGGMAELVRHGENGLLFAPGDANDLATQLQRLLENRSLLITLTGGIQTNKDSSRRN